MKIGQVDGPPSHKRLGLLPRTAGFWLVKLSDDLLHWSAAPAEHQDFIGALAQIKCGNYQT